ncbi:hypothetical protein [Thauera humireducens]|uniref:hypothetical protein n=1 Tax=Thauera humireducens TaxID=1134435 RepID=UPI00311D55F8
MAWIQTARPPLATRSNSAVWNWPARSFCQNSAYARDPRSSGLTKISCFWPRISPDRIAHQREEIAVRLEDGRVGAELDDRLRAIDGCKLGLDARP